MQARALQSAGKHTIHHDYNVSSTSPTQCKKIKEKTLSTARSSKLLLPILPTLHAIGTTALARSTATNASIVSGVRTPRPHDTGTQPKHLQTYSHEDKGIPNSNLGDMLPTVLHTATVTHEANWDTFCQRKHRTTREPPIPPAMCASIH